MERAYTVAEIDALRTICDSKWCSGYFFYPPIGDGAHIRDGVVFQFSGGRSYKQNERDIGVEQLVRTYMLGGITAEDIRVEYEATERARFDEGWARLEELNTEAAEIQKAKRK